MHRYNSLYIILIKNNTFVRVRSKTFNKYIQNHLEVESVFNNICLDNAIETIIMKPYTGIFIYKKHYELNWI